jgi:hypothetical protein
MHGTITLASHVVAASSNNSFNLIDVIAWICVPLFIFLAGVIYGVIKGAIRFAQHMTRSEKTQESIAATNTDIRDSMNSFMEKTNTHLNIHDQEIAVLNWRSGLNGGHLYNRQQQPPPIGNASAEG